MSSAGQVTIVLGVSGTGKSAGCLVRLIEDFFPRPHLGTLITNIPINLERLREYFDDLHKRGKSDVTGAECVARVMQIPKEWTDGWKRRDVRFDPMQCIQSIEGAYRIVIDECQDYFGADSPLSWQQMFLAFVNRARHGGGRVELLTQTPEGIPFAVMKSAEVIIQVVGAKVKRDGFFNILMNDWYNVFAAYRRKWSSKVWFTEKVNVGERSAMENDERVYRLTDWIFSFYQSGGAVEGSNKSGRPLEDWEVFPASKVYRMFLARNWWRFPCSKLGLVSGWPSRALLC